jgi:hypothetical protein
VNERATFGELATAATGHLTQALRPADPYAGGAARRPGTLYAGEIRRALYSLTSVIDRFLPDTSEQLPPAWQDAGTAAREHLRAAVAPGLH